MKQTSFDIIKKAFDKDGFEVYDFNKDPNFNNLKNPDQEVMVYPDGSIQFNGRTGMMAIHRAPTVKIDDTVRQKKAFYVEGNNYEMGFLIGIMAANDVHRMAYDFLDNIVPAFINPNEDKDKYKKIKDVIADLIEVATGYYLQKWPDDVPKEYINEAIGMYDGCVKYNESIGEHTKITLLSRLFALNLGIDCILSHVYTSFGLKEIGVLAHELKIPFMCNAFSIKGNAVEPGNHFFGRDFMFSTADVFQDTACMIIYNQDTPGAIPTVSQSAPGFFGSVTAMNLNGIAAGTDMNPSSMCEPERPGFNSLGLVRDSVQNSASIDDYVNRIKNTQRGVSWFYPAADGQSGRACFIEAGKSTGTQAFPYFDYFDDNSPYLQALTAAGLDQKFIDDNQKIAPLDGMFVRESDYTYPDNYFTFNKTLVDTYNKANGKNVPYINTDKYGYINKTTCQKTIDSKPNPNYPGTDDKNCPATYYFAPQRETDDDLIIVTNGNITPEMRLTTMNDWIEILAGGDMNDIQWRYDELNFELLTAIDEFKADPGKLIDNLKARQIIDFRAPGSNDYNVKFPKDNWQTIEINGSISLCELKTSKVITSHYGYYGDAWITITLPNYFG